MNYQDINILSNHDTISGRNLSIDCNMIKKGEYARLSNFISKTLVQNTGVDNIIIDLYACLKDGNHVIVRSTDEWNGVVDSLTEYYSIQVLAWVIGNPPENLIIRFVFYQGDNNDTLSQISLPDVVTMTYKQLKQLTQSTALFPYMEQCIKKNLESNYELVNTSFHCMDSSPTEEQFRMITSISQFPEMMNSLRYSTKIQSFNIDVLAYVNVIQPSPAKFVYPSSSSSTNDSPEVVQNYIGIGINKQTNEVRQVLSHATSAIKNNNERFLPSVPTRRDQHSQDARDTNTNGAMKKGTSSSFLPTNTVQHGLISGNERMVNSIQSDGFMTAGKGTRIHVSDENLSKAAKLLQPDTKNHIEAPTSLGTTSKGMMGKGMMGKGMMGKGMMGKGTPSAITSAKMSQNRNRPRPLTQTLLTDVNGGLKSMMTQTKTPSTLTLQQNYGHKRKLVEHSSTTPISTQTNMKKDPPKSNVSSSTSPKTVATSQKKTAPIKATSPKAIAPTIKRNTALNVRNAMSQKAIASSTTSPKTVPREKMTGTANDTVATSQKAKTIAPTTQRTSSLTSQKTVPTQKKNNTSNVPVAMSQKVTSTEGKTGPPEPLTTSTLNSSQQKTAPTTKRTTASNVQGANDSVATAQKAIPPTTKRITASTSQKKHDDLHNISIEIEELDKKLKQQVLELNTIYPHVDTAIREIKAYHDKTRLLHASSNIQERLVQLQENMNKRDELQNRKQQLINLP